MPNIPTYLPELPMGQGPGRTNLVDVPTGRGVNAGGYINAIGLPTVSNETFMGEVRGDMAMAGAISQVGDMLGQLAEKEIQAKNYADVSAAEDRLKTRFAEWENNKPQGAPDTWAQSWKSESESAIKEIMNDRSLSQSAKEELQIRLGRFSTNAHIQVATSATKAQFQRAQGANQARYMQKMEAQDYEGAMGEVDYAISQGWRFEDDRVRTEMEIKGRKSEGLKAEISRYALLGDEDGIETTLSKAKELGWTDEDIELTRVRGKLDAQQNREIMRNREQHDFLADMSYRRAQGEILVPSQVEGLVAAGKIDKATGAKMLAASKSEVGALPGEFSKFLDEVQLYDPDDDAKYEKAASLQRRAAELGLRPDQAMQFNAVFETAQKENADVTKRIETAGLVAARQTIRSAFEKGGIVRVWNKDLDAALQDPQKLTSYGIPADQAERIRNLALGRPENGTKGKSDYIPAIPQDKTAALREFQQAAQTAIPQDDLHPSVLEVLQKAATAGADGTMEDPKKAMDAVFAQEMMTRKMEAWFTAETKKNGIPPDDMAVKRKTGEFLTSRLQGAATKSLVPKRGGPGSEISVRGFIPAADLADKLPEPLKPYAKTFEEAGKLHGLDPYALAAISMLETGGGTSKAFRDKKNAMGISDSSGPIALDSVEDSIMRQAATLARQDGPYSGADDLATIGGIYAPPGADNDPNGTNGGWSAGVASYYRKLKD